MLTTGTGSGKSLSYIVPIVDSVLWQRATGSYEPGVKAIIVYPMNALARMVLQTVPGLSICCRPEREQRRPPVRVLHSVGNHETTV
ncbi:MAG: DEAD/DEAH box helicase [Pseudonocardiaceae bacterium]